ncbi:malate dehydrogenase MDH2 Ecym_2046 [Eremothecium cymbalariae DBVPG|uniref:malate dehydrogenase n=1 Tax=Eremothecium cymbalariae (strain CBS 270.75 / DBVPG 7215 / KCTC 17166 / NRRL Y-17582) TaxID=931890 RepID=G8JP03_ERECY|nr:Hypothetical protein Ecym_2046 [Eremothecium cymbalariae DBVPG\
MPHITETTGSTVKVAVLGAAGGIGQSLSLLLKTQLSQLLKPDQHAGIRLELALYDIAAQVLDGVAADLSHINTPVSLKHYVPASREDQTALHACLENSAVVIIPAGVPRKPGMTRDDLLAVNGKIVAGLADSIARVCDLKRAFVLVISNPVNTLVPVVVNKLISTAQSLKRDCKGIERRVFGVTQLDMVRASAFVQQYSDYENNELPHVPVIGGHSGETIVPLLGAAQKRYGFSADQRFALVRRIQYGGDEVVKAKNGAGSATLSMAYAAYVTAVPFVELFLGTRDSFTGTLFVSLIDHSGKPIAAGAQELLAATDHTAYFAAPVTITVHDGVTAVDYKVLDLADEEDKTKLLPACVKGLKSNIEAGLSLDV